MENLSEKALNLIQETSEEAKAINAQVEAEREAGKQRLRADLTQYWQRDKENLIAFDKKAIEVANLLQRVESIAKRFDNVGRVLQDVQNHLESEYNAQLGMRTLLTKQIEDTETRLKAIS